MTPKNVYVKFDPETGKWLVLEMTPLESYVDDVERYGADIANENQRALDSALPTYEESLQWYDDENE